MTRFLVAAAAALLAFSAQAQTWPTKPIRLVVPFAPGGSSSIVARSVAAEMSKTLGQEIYIENGINAPAKTPAAIIKRLADEAANAARKPSVAEPFAVDSAEAVGSTPKEYADYIASEQARWSEVVRKAGIKAN